MLVRWIASWLCKKQYSLNPNQCNLSSIDRLLINQAVRTALSTQHNNTRHRIGGAVNYWYSMFIIIEYHLKWSCGEAASTLAHFLLHTVVNNLPPCTSQHWHCMFTRHLQYIGTAANNKPIFIIIAHRWFYALQHYQWSIKGWHSVFPLRKALALMEGSGKTFFSNVWTAPCNTLVFQHLHLPREIANTRDKSNPTLGRVPHYLYLIF